MLCMYQQLMPTLNHYNAWTQTTFKFKYKTTDGIGYPRHRAIWPHFFKVPIAIASFEDFINFGGYKLHPTKLKNVAYMRDFANVQAQGVFDLFACCHLLFPIMDVEWWG